MKLFAIDAKKNLEGKRSVEKERKRKRNNCVEKIIETS